MSKVDLHHPGAAPPRAPPGRPAAAPSVELARPAGPKVEVSHSRCISCAGCVGVCPVDTITLQELHLTIDQGPCISCGLCIQFCPVGALTPGADYGARPTPRVQRVVLV